MKSIFYFLLIPLLFIGYSSCSDSDKEETYPLTFEKSDYSVMSGYSYSVMIRSGNGKYTITPENKEVIEASYEPYYGVPFGGIIVKGLKKGSTVLSVKDDTTGETVKLNIIVTDAYMNLSISAIVPAAKISNAENKAKIEKEIGDNALLTGGYFFSLIKDEGKTMYLFKSKEDLSKGAYAHKGTYSFKEELNGPYLIFNYTKNGAPETHSYLLSDSSGINILSLFFGLGWNKSKSISQIYSLILTEDFTEYYKAIYPDLAEATLKIHIGISSLNAGVELPVELVK